MNQNSTSGAILNNMIIDSEHDLTCLKQSNEGHEELRNGPLFEFLFVIPKLNLILLKSCPNLDTMSINKEFIIWCLDMDTFKPIHTLRLQDCSLFGFIQRENYFIANTEYGSLLIYNLSRPKGFVMVRRLKAYRGFVSQIIEIPNEPFFASYGYDQGSRRKFSIKIWSTFSFQLIVRIKVEIETNINIVYVKSAQCFAVAKECDITLFAYRSRQKIRKISMEIYGKRISQQIFFEDSGLMFVVLEAERGEAFKKHTIMAWIFGNKGDYKQLELNTDLKCRDPIFVENKHSILGFTEENRLVEFNWQADSNKLNIGEKSERALSSQSVIKNIDHGRLLQLIDGSRIRIWKY